MLWNLTGFFNAATAMEVVLTRLLSACGIATIGLVDGSPVGYSFSRARIASLYVSFTKPCFSKASASKEITSSFVDASTCGNTSSFVTTTLILISLSPFLLS